MGRPRRTHPEPKPTGNRGPDRLWVLRPQIDVLEDGAVKRKERTCYSPAGVTSLKQARLWRDEICADLNRNRIDSVVDQTPFAHVIEVYQTKYLPSLKPNSQTAYTSEIERRLLPQFGKLRLCDLTSIRIQEWVNWMAAQKWSHATMTQAMAVFRSIWEVAADWGYTTARCPATRRTRIPETPRAVRRAITPQEFLRLRGIMREDRRLALDLAAFCGLRVGEIAALRRANLDYDAQTIHVVENMAPGNEVSTTKGLKGELPMGFLVNDLLSRCPAEAPPTQRVFHDISYRALQACIRETFIRAGLGRPGQGAHLLRRFYATYTAESRDSIRAIQEAMRHTSPEMTQHYITPSMAWKTAAMEALRRTVYFGSFSETASKPQ